jgi:hypothetical protein
MSKFRQPIGAGHRVGNDRELVTKTNNITPADALNISSSLEPGSAFSPLLPLCSIACAGRH